MNLLRPTPQVHVCMYVCFYVCRICMYVCMSVRICARARTHTHTHTYTYIYMASGISSFEWQSNLRLYIEKGTRPRDIKCVASVCNVKTDYGFHYVGDDWTPLVRTSTSHSVQLALITTQHLSFGSILGGSPASGRTHIVRCTANTLGVPCVVVQVSVCVCVCFELLCLCVVCA
jgi:hypothetical protein